jgi:hypothetical protein
LPGPLRSAFAVPVRPRRQHPRLSCLARCSARRAASSAGPSPDHPAPCAVQGQTDGGAPFTVVRVLVKPSCWYRLSHISKIVPEAGIHCPHPLGTPAQVADSRSKVLSAPWIKSAICPGGSILPACAADDIPSARVCPGLFQAERAQEASPVDGPCWRARRSAGPHQGRHGRLVLGCSDVHRWTASPCA